MALRWIDSFDHYATADVASKYEASQGSTAPTITSTARNGGLALSLNDGNTPAVVTKVLDAQQTWIVGFALRYTNSGADKEFLDILDGGTTHATLKYQASTGRWLFTGAWGTATSASVFSVNVWYYVEVKITIADSPGGSYEVRVNGATEMSGSGVDTRNAGNASADRIRLRAGSSSNTSTARIFDDFYICDGTGSAPTNTFLGDCRVEALYPNGDGNSSVLVGSDGNSVSNYLLVDETAPNSDTDYVASATVGDKDTYTYTNPTPTAGTVYGVQINMHARKDDAGTRKIVSVARSGGTEVDGPAKTLTTSYLYYCDPRETKPGGGSWSLSDVSGAEFGVKVDT